MIGTVDGKRAQRRGDEDGQYGHCQHDITAGKAHAQRDGADCGLYGRLGTVGQHTECALSEGKAGAQQAHPYAQHSEEKYQKDEQHRLCAGARGIAQVHCGAHQNKQQQLGGYPKLCIFGREPRGAEVASVIGISLTTLIFGGVTSASILTFGPVLNEVGKAKGIHPYRRANLLDAVANSLPAIVPFLSVFVFIGSALTGLSPVAVAGGTLYGFTLFAVMVVAVATGWGRDFEGKNGEAVKQPVEETAQSSK